MTTGAGEANAAPNDVPRLGRVTALGWIRAMTPGSEGGGSQPHLFATTAGSFMVKVSNNPQGARVLVNDLVGGLCLDWLGVHHPRPAVVDVSQDVIDDSPGAKFADGTVLAPGLAFGSEYWQSDAQGTIPVDQIVNEDDIAGTMTLDTWIHSYDGRQYRTRPEPEQPGKYEAVPIDQGHCFGNPGWTPDTLAAARAVTVSTPIKPVSTPIVTVFVKRLRAFDRQASATLLAHVPSEWITDEEREALLVYLAERAALAAGALSAQYGIGDPGE